MQSIKRLIGRILHIARMDFFMRDRGPTWLVEHTRDSSDFSQPKSGQRVTVVSFFGGPLDGWTDTVLLDPDDHNHDRLALPISANMFKMAAGQHGSQPALVTSVAFYQVERRPSERRYHFSGSAKNQLAAEVSPHFLNRTTLRSTDRVE